MRKIILNRHKVIKENKREFYNIFKVLLSDFFDPVFGFNLSKFDRRIIKSKNNEFIKNRIEKDYGKEGVDIIIDLL